MKFNNLIKCWPGLFPGSFKEPFLQFRDHVRAKGCWTEVWTCDINSALKLMCGWDSGSDWVFEDVFCGAQVLGNVRGFFFFLFLQSVPWVSCFDETWQSYKTCRDPILDSFFFFIVGPCQSTAELVDATNTKKGFLFFNCKAENIKELFW